MPSWDEAIEIMRESVETEAKNKLGRDLTQPERQAIRNIKSGMMLESIERCFTAKPKADAERELALLVESDKKNNPNGSG